MKKAGLLKQTLIFALIPESILIIGQLLFVAMYNLANPVNIALDDSFMVSTGFYIFQIGGFFLSFIFFYMLIVRDKGQHPQVAILFLFISVAIELSFYVLTPASFRFVYVFSFLDKIMAILLAMFTYLVYKDAFYILISKKGKA